VEAETCHLRIDHKMLHEPMNIRNAMALEEYHAKRKFTETPEPVGRVRRKIMTRMFVVQKHHARRLHYDFRLTIDGVLVSWAMPKGPSMNPSDKHLAIRTEDHPLEYTEFEGVIPHGLYGAGTVMVWDKGTYDTKEGVAASGQLARGRLDVELHGAKLCGGFTLVRYRKRSADLVGKEQWLLIKHRDECADPAWDAEDRRFDCSVLTGRSMKEIERAGSDTAPRRQMASANQVKD
jgi:bifunctional non-homologous end joining protein LigD